jgi:hypothetical protein
MQLYKCKYSPLVGDYTNVTRLRIFKFILPYVPLEISFSWMFVGYGQRARLQKKRTQIAYRVEKRLAMEESFFNDKSLRDFRNIIHENVYVLAVGSSRL